MKRLILNMFVISFVAGAFYSQTRNVTAAHVDDDDIDPWEHFVYQAVQVRDYAGPHLDTISIDTALPSRQGRIRIRACLIFIGQPVTGISLTASEQYGDSLQAVSYSLSKTRSGWELDGDRPEATRPLFFKISRTLLLKALQDASERRNAPEFQDVYV